MCFERCSALLFGRGIRFPTGGDCRCIQICYTSGLLMNCSQEFEELKSQKKCPEVDPS